MTEEEIIFWIENAPEDTHEQYLRKLDKYKEIIDTIPNNLLRFHLDDQVKKEHYEVAQYIKETAEKRNFSL